MIKSTLIEMLQTPNREGVVTDGNAEVRVICDGKLYKLDTSVGFMRYPDDDETHIQLHTGEQIEWETIMKGK